MIRRSLTVPTAVFLAGVLVVLGGFVLLSRGHAAAAGPDYTGMMGNGGGMMGAGGMMGRAFGATVQTSVTGGDLHAVRDRVENQLATSGYNGFSVGEIMRSRTTTTCSSRTPPASPRSSCLRVRGAAG
jgi:hypothetical protein